MEDLRDCPISREEIAEIACACVGRLIGQAIRIMDSLEQLTGYPADSISEMIQGGDHTPQAERRAELIDNLGRIPAVVLQLSWEFRFMTGKWERYILGLIDGLSGDTLRKRAGLGEKEHRIIMRKLNEMLERALRAEASGKKS